MGKKRVKKGLIGKIFGDGNYICTLHYCTCTSKSKMYMHLKIIINNDNDSNQKELGSSL